jgi:acetylornithine deacetylase/succinyl-diaminopimelate desuccinylase-like protein
LSAADNRRIAALASDRAVHRAFAWLHLREPQLRTWQLEFLAIPAPPFAEAERAAWFCERFRDLGLERPHLDAEGNALAELRGGDANGPVVMLSAHLDTVFPAGTDCTPREDAAQILCPGASDNGAGLAALLGIAAALKASEVVLPCTILFAANVGEEGEGDLRGMRRIFAEGEPYAARIRAAVALEGSGESTVVDRALGARRLRVTVSGLGGHSWVDAGRANPIMALAAALVAVGKLRIPSRPRTTLNVGTMRGGTSVNSIPEHATADLDLRSTSTLELDRMELAVLRTIEAELRSSEDLKLNVERIGNRPAGGLATSSALYGSLRAVDRHLNLMTDARIGSTDANLPLSLGVPALAIGAGGRGWGIHTLAERYDPTGREIALRRVLLLVMDMCGVVAGA